MAVSEDLSDDALHALMPERPLRTYPALLSTESDARAWARSDAPVGALVVADYQASPRGRGGLSWTCRPGRDLGFTLVLRPKLTPDEEGWLYVAAAMAVLDVLGADASVDWPDGIYRDGRRVADVAGHAGLGAEGVAWVVINVLVYDVPNPRGHLLTQLAEAIEGRQQPEPRTLAHYCERCTTLGREVIAHLIPTWPDGVQIAGTAADVREDGSLVIDQAPAGRRIAVRPQHLARIETERE